MLSHLQSPYLSVCNRSISSHLPVTDCAANITPFNKSPLQAYLCKPQPARRQLAAGQQLNLRRDACGTSEHHQLHSRAMGNARDVTEHGHPRAKPVPPLCIIVHDRFIFNELPRNFSNPCRCLLATVPCDVEVHCVSTHHVERSKEVQCTGIVLVFQTLPAQTPVPALGVMLVHAAGLHPCPSRAQSCSQTIYYCHTSRKELFILVAILGNQETANGPAENHRMV